MDMHFMRSLKVSFPTVALLATVLLLAIWIVNSRDSVPLPPWLGNAIRQGRALHATWPLASILSFGLAHFLSSSFGIPGGCTALNVSSGAVFGFWKGCAVVYPITILAACTGYFAAAKLRHRPFFARYEPLLASLRTRLNAGGFLALIMLRLNPFLPFGVLNPILGLLQVPFSTFLASTFVGVFLDVILLNSIGATLAAADAKDNAYDSTRMLLTFCGLLAIFVVIHHLQGRSEVRVFNKTTFHKSAERE